jgi:hypothetical protein
MLRRWGTLLSMTVKDFKKSVLSPGPRRLINPYHAILLYPTGILSTTCAGHAMNSSSQASTSLEENLIRSGGLHPDDLAFNQAGELSPWQKRWLTLEVAAWGFQIGIDLVFMGCAWLFYYFQYFQSQHNLQIFTIGGLFWSCMLGVSILFCIDHMQPLCSDIQNIEVKSISGAISKYCGFRMGRREVTIGYWGLEIRGHKFAVNPSVYASLVQHQTYRLFYLPNANRLINIEPLLQAHAEK